MGRTRSRTRPRLRILVLTSMFLLLTAQLIWWIIFFQQNRERYALLERQHDQLRIAVLRGQPAPGLVRGPDGKLVVDPQVQAARDRRDARQLFMLIAETCFVLAVLGYGHYRIARSIRNELRLGEERSVFINSVSHEWKTPLAALLLGLQTLQRQQLSQEEQNEILSEGISAVRSLNEQLNDLLTAAGIERARDDLRHVITSAPTDLPGALRQAVDVAARESGNRGMPIDLHVAPDAQALRILLRGDILERILMAVIRNAFSYGASADELRVVISVDRQGRDAVVRIADNGPGIGAEEAERIFQPLYRGPAHASGGLPGTGMGLYLARELLSLAWGTIQVAEPRGSEPPGAVFEIRLPATDARPQEQNR